MFFALSPLRGGSTGRSVHQRLIVLREGMPGSLAIWFNVAPAAMRSHTRFPTAGLKMWREFGAGVSASTSIQSALVRALRRPHREGRVPAPPLLLRAWCRVSCGSWSNLAFIATLMDFGVEFVAVDNPQELPRRRRWNPKPQWEFPRLCRGGSKSLTYPAVDTAGLSAKLRIVSRQAHEEECDRWTTMRG